MTDSACSADSIDMASLTAPAGAVEALMADFIDRRPLPSNLREAIRYSLLGSGKRLRPILCVRACEAVGGRADDALAPAAAIEMIHAFSLVHDDLPAMDDDDLRRGRPTLHKHTNEAMAILAGDAMTALAFELIATEITDPQACAAITFELAKATNDMIAGQVHDTLPVEGAGDREPDESDDAFAQRQLERLRTIHRHKTEALLRCACRMGAIQGGATREQMDLLTTYAEAVGLMFQVVDDLLDVTQTTKHLGKAAGKDAEQGKLTYPGLIGVEASRAEVQRLRTQALDALQSLGENAHPLRDLCEYLAVRTR